MVAVAAEAAPATATPPKPVPGSPLVAAKKEEEATPAPKKKKDEAAEDSDSQESGEEDALLPEAEPTVPRNEVAEGTTKFREDAVHVYGLDFLKTGHMEEIFSQFNHRYIEWINDSSANVVFRDAKSAKKALESISYPTPGDDPWRRTPDILVHDDLPAVYLQMRLAVASDSKPRRKAVPSATVRYYGEQNSEVALDRALPLTGPRSVADSRKASAEAAAAASSTAAAVPAKRRAKVISEEELAKRRRRAERFGESQEVAVLETSPVAAAEASTASAGSRKAPAITPAEAPKTAEEVEAEEAKRRKRAERFSQEATDTAAAALPAEEAKADAAKPAEEAAAESETTAAAPAADVPSTNGGLAAEDDAAAKAPGDGTSGSAAAEAPSGDGEGSAAAAEEPSGEAGGEA